MTKPSRTLRRVWLALFLLLPIAVGVGFSATLAGARAAAQAPEPRKVTLRAVHYEVTASLSPGNHMLTARAKVDFLASATARNVEAELHPNLKLNGVYSADRKPLPFDREESGLVKVALPDAVPSGEKITLIFDYAGQLNEDETALPGSVRWAYVGEEGSYLLLSARWFPLTDYPGNRYTAVFDIAVPENVAVVGTGKTLAPTVISSTAAPAPAAAAAQEPAKAPAKGKAKRPAEPPAPPPQPPLPLIVKPGSVLYSFRVERPEAAGTFVAANIQLVPVSSEGLSVSVFVPSPQTNTAQGYGESLARIVDFYTDEFGTLPQPNLAVVQLPNVAGVPHGYSAPGLLLVNARQWDPKVNYRLLAQLAAMQWWSSEVLPASANDAWLADGLARYSEALYVQHLASEEGFNRVLEECAVGTLMYEDAAPIVQASRLQPATAEYRSVVVNKGAMVFHMLRGQIGDAAFRALLKAYYANFSGKSARLEDFESLAQATAQANPPAAPAPAAPTGGDAAAAPSPRPAPNLVPFFAQWLRSTGIPEFKMEYVIYRTQKGFRIVGKVKQDLETFRMRVDVKVETEGNPETASIEVIGANSDFTIETFGRPKPGGIILDPNNHLLKSSTRLRVRAGIARGEQFAEEGKYYEAVQQYQRALETQKNSSLAHFRMAEGFFYQKNLQAAANAFRDAIDGDRDPKWIEVWSHIYLGKIFDLTGQRERAVNEYQKARETNDDTGSAQAEAEKYLKEPYAEKAKPSS